MIKISYEMATAAIGGSIPDFKKCYFIILIIVTRKNYNNN